MKTRKKRHSKKIKTSKHIRLKKHLYHTQPYDTEIKPGTYNGYVKHKLQAELKNDLNIVGDFYLPKADTIVPQEFKWTNVVEHK